MKTPNLITYLMMTEAAAQQLVDALLLVSNRHSQQADVHFQCSHFANQCGRQLTSLGSLLEENKKTNDQGLQLIVDMILHRVLPGAMGMLRDLQDVALLTFEVYLNWVIVKQAAHTLHDDELIKSSEEFSKELENQINWYKTKIKTAAPQSITVPES